MHQKILKFQLVLLLPIAAIGCGKANRAAVNGTVLLDDIPVDGGNISFIPDKTNPGPSAWGEIQAGKYAIAASQGPGVGTNRVEIRWVRKTGRMVNATEEETIEAIPVNYNSHSNLNADLKPGDNKADFDLKSK